MAKRVLMILIVVAIVVGGGYYAVKQLVPEKAEEVQGPVYSTFEVKKGDISAGVEVTGQLNPTQSGGIRAPGDRYTGTGGQYVIDQFLVGEGDEVVQGQVVATLLATDLNNKLTDLKEQVESQKKQLSQLTGLSLDEIDYINPSQGLQIIAPISGRIMNLEAKEGKELTQGQIVASIVDNSKFKVAAKLTPTEYGRVSVGQKVALSFPYFEGIVEGTITDINSSPMPDDTEEDKFGTNFIYAATIEAENPGLIQANMEVKIGLSYSEDNSPTSISYFLYSGKVDGFVDEEKLISPVKAVATQVHVKGMQEVKKGDVIVTMAGNDVREMIQEKTEKIRELNNEMRDYYAKLDQLEIRSPMNGIVAGIWRQPGETVAAGDWLGDVYNTSDMRIYSEVDDIDVLQIKQDAPVSITVDAMPTEKFEGKVARIYTMGKDRTSGLTRFQVEIEVIGGPQLRPGMQARAKVDAGSAQGVLLIPLEAIFEEDGVTKVEILGDDGVPKVVTVKLGLMNDKLAEVTEGLKEGDKVVTGSTADLLPSQHIKSNDSIIPSTGDDNNNENGGNTENNGANTNGSN
ncbi:efflux RND transporter periplasmic adaptor subunit [Proteiniborus sp. MB09-C3]|uniref:efflux RND transporter periplasmic adaptor subunit n=1 Tax=Proteiniborus sp. MB09-C3 TaxID=3050072 RepID=UPI0025529BE9|nr:efflux RND transporter periplasmic adaptor subunit [Proteiniborus sp. MB09-C3]WIV11026.1 efflux RND transporter periplasmic adaptor subunit [Proteiniborus sp. MB09-C3]